SAAHVRLRGNDAYAPRILRPCDGRRHRGPHVGRLGTRVPHPRPHRDRAVALQGLASPATGASTATRGGTVSILAYHFVNNTLRDGRPVPADGEWLEHDGPIVICKSGLHASRRPWHALMYAPGPVLCLVEVEGIEAEHEDKLVARRRRLVRRVELTDDLRAFARQCALDVIHLWDAPDVVRRYRETGDESLRNAAWAAATDTMRDVTTAAIWDIAKAAAWDAARE